MANAGPVLPIYSPLDNRFTAVDWPVGQDTLRWQCEQRGPTQTVLGESLFFLLRHISATGLPISPEDAQEGHECGDGLDEHDNTLIISICI